ncbi:MAG: hypothetical protein CVU38_01495, partial [Chloroflexi bacterium HGW-Chloroflexi-1]
MSQSRWGNMIEDPPVRQVFDITAAWITDIPVIAVPCLLCGEREIVRLNTFLLNGRRFHTVRCANDGMMWLDPQPTAAFYDQLYAEHYHVAGEEDPLLEQATLDVHSDEVKLRETAALRLDEIERYAAPGRFLEVGFGSGHTLMEASARGWAVLGVEVAQSCVDAALARGIPAVLGRFPGVPHPVPGGGIRSFDVIAMYSVIEHVHDPAAYLRRAHELLKPGGLLVLRLPDTGAEGPPASLIAHLYHFNQTTITELLRRHGFSVQQIGAFGLWKPKRYPGELWSMNVIARSEGRSALVEGDHRGHLPAQTRVEPVEPDRGVVRARHGEHGC